MTPTENQLQKPDHQVPLSLPLAEEIERALAMMRRVRTAQAAQEKQEALQTAGNTYVLPEPPVLRVSGSSQHD